MAVTEHPTFCRICEASCGMVATVQDGRITKLRPDAEHPLSQGAACPKGIAMLEVHADPDRVLHPLRRRADGSGFDRVGWDEALDDIGTRLATIRAEHGGGAIGWYMGNPGAFSYSHPVWVKGFLDALGSQHYYTASSQDVSNRFAASAMLYGSPAVVPIPDLDHTDLLLVVGANPFVSHASLLTAPRIREDLKAITARGGRVVVVDPRRTETARHFEHVAIRPDTDAWLMLGLLHVLFAEGLADRDALARQSTGSAWLETAVRDVTPQDAAVHTGIPADTIIALARDLAAAPSAAVYGRTGSCLGRFGTLVSFLMDAVNVVTGNLDRRGGAVFGLPAVSLDEVAEKTGLDTYGKHHSRVGGFPDVLGAMPASLIPREITTPGDGSLRALLVSAGNPVLSVPDAGAMSAALGQLDLMVSIDLYLTETNRAADYILPATSFLEREDLPLAVLGFARTPYVQWTEAIVEPAGEARQEWEIIEAISARLGITPSTDRTLRALGRLGIKLSPRRMADVLIRTGRDGDLFGLRRSGPRLTLAKVAAAPHGLQLADTLPTGILRQKVRHGDGRVHLDPAAIVGELERLLEDGRGVDDPDFPLRLIGLRELRSHNSWMHNAPKLMAGSARTHAARLHPEDAQALGVAAGGRVRIVSKDGEIEVDVRVTDEVTPGVVAVPHGWGHHGGWRVANAAGGANTNVLAGSAPSDLEPLAGMAFLNGIRVRLEAVPAVAGAADAVVAAPASAVS
jgi:anaerobic selenocysteine-containing dehydrogenase